MRKLGDAFYGAQGPVDRIRQLAPKTGLFNLKEEAKACTTDYVLYGWTGIVPKSCHNGACHPHQLSMADVGLAQPPDRADGERRRAKVIVFGPYESGKSNEGLTDVHDLGRIPASFNGYIWVEDIWAIGPALKG